MLAQAFKQRNHTRKDACGIAGMIGEVIAKLANQLIGHRLLASMVEEEEPGR
jgi:hypothetical protein